MEGIVYVATSEDGHIADAEGGVSWLEQFHGVDYGYEKFLAGMDRLVMGRGTYDQVRGFGDWPYVGKETTVLTSTELGDELPGVTAWTAGPKALCRDLLRRVVRCWIVGGSQTIDALLRGGMVHTLDLFIMPVKLGQGVPLWLSPPDLTRWGRFELATYDNGANHIRYLAPPC